MYLPYYTQCSPLCIWHSFNIVPYTMWLIHQSFPMSCMTTLSILNIGHHHCIALYFDSILTMHLSKQQRSLNTVTAFQQWTQQFRVDILLIEQVPPTTHHQPPPFMQRTSLQRRLSKVSMALISINFKDMSLNMISHQWSLMLCLIHHFLLSIGQGIIGLCYVAPITPPGKPMFFIIDYGSCICL